MYLLVVTILRSQSVSLILRMYLSFWLWCKGGCEGGCEGVVSMFLVQRKKYEET